MKYFLNIMILFTMMFTTSAFSYEVDKKVSECYVSSYENGKRMIQEISDCVEEELEKDTEAGKTLKKAFTPLDAEETSNRLRNILYFMSGFAVIFTVFKLFLLMRKEEQIGAEKTMSDMTFKILIVSSITAGIVTPNLLSWGAESLLNKFYNEPATFYTAMNIQKSQSSTVKNHAVKNSKTFITEKVLEISKIAIQNQTCAIGKYQELITPYVKEDNLILGDDKQISCINNYVKENEGKTIQELGNKMLLPSAIYNCSIEVNTITKNCGSIIANTDYPELNVVVDKYVKELALFTNEYLGYFCENAKVNNRQNYNAYCITFIDDVKTPFTSEKTLLELDSEFININKNFSIDFEIALANSIELPDDFESDINILDLYGNLKGFMELETYDYLYKDDIKKQVNKVDGLLALSKNTNGSIASETEEVELVMEDASDFLFYIKNRINSYYDSDELLKIAFNDDFAFISDIKLLFGDYNDPSGQFKVSFVPLQIIQENRENLLKVATLLKGSSLAIKEWNKLSDTKTSKIWESVDDFAMLIILVAYFPELFSLFMIVFTVGGITMKLLEALCVGIIELSAIIFVKKEPHILANRLTQLYIAMIVKSLVCVFALTIGSVFAVVGLNVMNSIPLINDNLALMFIAGIVLQCLMIMYLIRKTIWVNTFLHKYLQTGIDGYKGDIKTGIKNAKNSLS